MTNSLKSPRGQIVAAVAFDSQTEAVARTIASLARTYEMAVHLVNVVEPTLANPWIQLSSAEMAYIPVYPEIDEAERQSRLKNMEELARRFELPFKTTSAVLYGLKSQTIIAEAVAKRANVLVTGFDPKSYRLALTGMSTALMLLSDAPMPVLAVAEGAVPDFAKSGFKILVADDFCEGTEEAVRKTFELASSLDKAKVRQVHVHGDFREALRANWEQIKARFPGKDCGDLTLESFWEKEQQALVAKGTGRGAPFRRKAELAGVDAKTEVRTAPRVGDEFRELAGEFAPDLLAFGRHRLLRARPFLIGRMAFKTMLEMNKPVLVVPPTGELYARLPFPAAT